MKAPLRHWWNLGAHWRDLYTHPKKENISPQTRTGKQGQTVLTILGLDEHYRYTIQVLRSNTHNLVMTLPPW